MKDKTCDNCTHQDRTYDESPCDVCKPDMWREYGYGSLDVVDEAEEEYKNYKSGNNCLVAELVIDKQHEAIQYLKQQLENQK